MKIQGIFTILLISIFLSKPCLAIDDWAGITVDKNITIPTCIVNSGSNGYALRTNSTEAGAISLGSGSIVNGNVTVGPAGNPVSVINGSNYSITGNISEAEQLISFTPVMVPTYLQAMPNQGSINYTRVLSTSGKFNQIVLHTFETLTINGDVDLYITGSISLGISTQLIINPNSSLTLYLGGDIIGGNSQGFNNLTRNSLNLGIYALNTSTNILLRNSSNLYGTFYAPSADVVIYNGANIYGMIAANSFSMKNSGVFYAVPEPASIFILALGGLLILKIKNRK